MVEASSRNSIIVPEDFAAVARGQAAPRRLTDRVGHEPDRAVAQRQVDAAGVPAAGGAPAQRGVQYSRVEAIGEAVPARVVRQIIMVVTGAAVLTGYPLEAA